MTSDEGFQLQGNPRRGGGGTAAVAVENDGLVADISPKVEARRTGAGVGPSLRVARAPTAPAGIRSGRTPKILQAVADALAIAAGLWFAARGRAGGEAAADYLLVGALSLPGWLVIVARYHLLSARHVQRVTQELVRVVHAAATGAAAMALVAVLVQADVHRNWLLMCVPAVAVCLTIDRAASRAVFQRLRATGRLTRRVVVLGTDQDAVTLCSTLGRAPKLGYEVVGFLDDALPPGTTVAGGRGVLGRSDDALDVVRSTSAHGVVIVPGAQAQVNAVTRRLIDAGIHVELSSRSPGHRSRTA